MDKEGRHVRNEGQTFGVTVDVIKAPRLPRPDQDQAGLTATAATSSGAAAASSTDLSGPRDVKWGDQAGLTATSLPSVASAQITVISIGTRTSAQIMNDDATVEMRNTFWKKQHHGYRKPVKDVRLDPQLARRVCATLLSRSDINDKDVEVIPVDCRRFHGKFQGRPGLHRQVQCEYLQDTHRMDKFVDYLLQVADPLSFTRNPKKRVICFYCNAGEHRSVAFAALFAAYAREQGSSVECIHTCSELWSRRSCGKCSACTTNPHDDMVTWFANFFVGRRRNPRRCHEFPFHVPKWGPKRTRQA